MPKNRHETRKRKSIISFDNLSEELKDLFKETYPNEDGGYKPYLQKTVKPNGEPIFSVPLETEDAIYMVKFEVKIDTHLVEEDLDKDFFSEKGDEESELDIIERDESGEGDSSHKEFTLKHGNYEESFMAGSNIPNIEDELAEEFSTNEEEEEEEDLPPEDDDLLDMEPDDDDLLDIENELLGEDFVTEKTKKKSVKKPSSKNDAKEPKKPAKGTKVKTEKQIKAKVPKTADAAKKSKTAKEQKTVKKATAKK